MERASLRLSSATLLTSRRTFSRNASPPASFLTTKSVTASAPSARITPLFVESFWSSSPRPAYVGLGCWPLRASSRAKIFSTSKDPARRASSAAAPPVRSRRTGCAPAPAPSGSAWCPARGAIYSQLRDLNLPDLLHQRLFRRARGGGGRREDGGRGVQRDVADRVGDIADSDRHALCRDRGYDRQLAAVVARPRA